MNTYEKVEDILRRYPQAKDNDNILVALYWWEELENNPHQIDREKFKLFFMTLMALKQISRSGRPKVIFTSEIIEFFCEALQTKKVSTFCLSILIFT